MSARATQISSVSWVLLTMGDRPEALGRAVASIPKGADWSTEVLVVANGATGVELPPTTAGAGAVQLRLVELDDNVGIPEGRNIGAAACTGELIFFLDDDAEVDDPALVARTLARFSDDPRLAVVSLRIVDPESGQTSQRHVPRPGAGDATVSGPATSFLGGACAVRRQAFEEVGGLPGAYFYALEETDLSWRLIDAGWRIHYDGEARVLHPRTEIARHGFSTRLTARNRVLLVRRLLPWLLAPIYLFNWTVITLVRGRSLATARDHCSGLRQGLTMPVERRPISWATVVQLTRLGRPPVL